MDFSQCCFIKEQYFLEHTDYINMLDPEDHKKQSRRTYMFLQAEVDGYIFYLPLRNNLGEPVRKFGRIGHPVPSKTRPNAGIDFRYALMVSDEHYVEHHDSQKIPASQYKKIADDYSAIQNEFRVYLHRYIKAARKGRIDREPLFRNSSLVNFNRQLNI